MQMLCKKWWLYLLLSVFLLLLLFFLYRACFYIPKPGFESRVTNKMQPKPVPGYALVGKECPELQVAEWIKGKPTTLEKLRGKVILLDFWGLWCGPCLQCFPKLIELHRKYSRDGLVIIAIHDSSEDKRTLLDADRKDFDLSKIPFRLALDSPPATVTDKQKGKGKTIEAYGISHFPTLLLITQDGKIEEAETGGNLEKRINLLLYGKVSKKYGRDLTVLEMIWYTDKTTIVRLITGGCLVLLLGIYLFVRVVWKFNH